MAERSTGKWSRQSTICEKSLILTKRVTLCEVEKKFCDFFWKKIIFDQSSIHKLSKKFDFKRFYRGSSEKPASLKPRDLLYPPRVTNWKNSDPPSRSCIYITLDLSFNKISCKNLFSSSRKKSLLNHFGSVKAVEGASLEEIEKVENCENPIEGYFTAFLSRPRISGAECVSVRKSYRILMTVGGITEVWFFGCRWGIFAKIHKIWKITKNHYFLQDDKIIKKIIRRLKWIDVGINLQI